jgi:putative addiction module CopG family antidote
MSKNQSLTITLPAELLQMVKDRVASGAYLDESDVVRDGLRALQARDAALERWLREDVVPVFDRIGRGEERLIPADQVFSEIALREQRRNAQKAP